MRPFSVIPTLFLLLWDKITSAQVFRYKKKKKFFFQNSKKLGYSFIKNDIYLYFPFIYQASIILGLTKIVVLNFTMYILTILTFSLKVNVFGK